MKLELTFDAIDSAGHRIDEMIESLVNKTVQKALNERLSNGPIPEFLQRKIEEWLRGNRKESTQVRYGSFPLGMVQRWIERAEASEIASVAWTKELPQEEGYYWWRPHCEIRLNYIYWVFQDKCAIYCWWCRQGQHNMQKVEDMGGEWFGPIVEP